MLWARSFDVALHHLVVERTVLGPAKKTKALSSVHDAEPGTTGTFPVQRLTQP